MTNPDWDRSKKNYDIVFRVLIIGCAAMCIVSVFIKTQPARNIVMGIAAALLFSAMIQFIMYKIKPGAFKNKSSNPDEES
jgi:FtsH-binding integral membrane protein